ncbi:hypothetical protein BV22DRAFT_85935 [Leucogyrophana mollusca]|uniref:Uncharacterized protein n=1 Tax=Leucogyrophana mollusca TaxID=85980 RepID=A0ACB8BWM7_9AGAM|nr:hypothetical protein BV22DRAFT_85935 [Leucogyrophana mollusca]
MVISQPTGCRGGIARIPDLVSYRRTQASFFVNLSPISTRLPFVCLLARFASSVYVCCYRSVRICRITSAVVLIDITLFCSAIAAVEYAAPTRREWLQPISPRRSGGGAKEDHWGGSRHTLLSHTVGNLQQVASPILGCSCDKNISQSTGAHVRSVASPGHKLVREDKYITLRQIIFEHEPDPHSYRQPLGVMSSRPRMPRVPFKA